MGYVTEQQHYEYAGYEPTIKLAQSLGWGEQPEGATGNEFADKDGFLDQDKALSAAIAYIEKRGVTVTY